MDEVRCAETEAGREGKRITPMEKKSCGAQIFSQIISCTDTEDVADDKTGSTAHTH